MSLSVKYAFQTPLLLRCLRAKALHGAAPYDAKKGTREELDAAEWDLMVSLQTYDPIHDHIRLEMDPDTVEPLIAGEGSLATERAFFTALYEAACPVVWSPNFADELPTGPRLMVHVRAYGRGGQGHLLIVEFDEEGRCFLSSTGREVEGDIRNRMTKWRYCSPKENADLNGALYKRPNPEDRPERQAARAAIKAVLGFSVEGTPNESGQWGPPWHIVRADTGEHIAGTPSAEGAAEMLEEVRVEAVLKALPPLEDPLKVQLLHSRIDLLETELGTARAAKADLERKLRDTNAMFAKEAGSAPRATRSPTRDFFRRVFGGH